jgi:hypothetical protein
MAEIEIPAVGDIEREESSFKLMHCVLNMIDNIANMKFS